MTRKEIKEKAKEQLGRQIFGDTWLWAVLVALIFSLIVSAAGTILPAIGILIIIGPLRYGFKTMFLKQARDGEKMKIEDLFKGFTGDFSQTFLIGLMTSVFVFLWSLLFVIPGIIKKYSYSMAYFIKADNPDYDWRKCIDASKAMMQGHKWDLFVLELSFIGWIIISYLLFGVGFLWLAPYMQASRAQFYESIKNSAYIQ